MRKCHLKCKSNTHSGVLPCFVDFPFPRCYFCKVDDVLQSELHGFADTSEHAYTTVVYLRATYSTITPSMSMVTAKTKVAPLKKLSIPRLELCVTQLLAKLINNMRQALTIDISYTHAWSDSTIVSIGWMEIREDLRDL